MHDQAHLKLLTIEDEKVVRTCIVTYFEDNGYTVYQAGNGEEGLALYREHHPDVILCDLQMPILDGFDVIQTIRNEDQDTPLIVVSGNGQIKDTAKAMRMGAWDYIAKPIRDLEELELAVQKCLERSKLLKKVNRYHTQLEVEIEKRTAELLAETVERKRSEEQVKSLRLQQVLIDSIPTPIIYQDLNGICQIVNVALANFLNTDKKLLVGQPCSELLPTEEKGSLTDKQLLVRGGEHAYESQISNGHHVLRDMLINKTRLDDDDGNPIGISVTYQDITERKELEKQLLGELSSNLSVFHTAPALLLVLDNNGHILRFNPACEKSTGYPTSECIGKRFQDLFGTPNGEKNILEALQKTVDSKRKINREFNFLARNQKEHWIFWSFSMLKNNAFGSGIGNTLVAVGLDITKKKQLIKSLKDQQEHLEEVVAERTSELVTAKKMADAANKAKGDFLANMSHEIRTPMNGVLGMTEQILSTKLSKQQQGYAKTIKTSANALLTIINDILDFSKIEAGKLDIVSHPFDLQATVTDVIELFSSKSQRKNISLGFDLEKTVPTNLIGDSGRLRQILSNLISNAIKFTSEGGVELSVGGEQEPNNSANILIKFTVIDTGVGIDLDKQEMVFEKFTQEEATTTRKYGGTGLGLAICRQLTELMGGSIQLESSKKGGSSFSFKIPFEINHKPLESIAEQVTIDYNLATASNLFTDTKILLVEDNTINQLVATEFLERFGCDVYIANDGQEAIDLHRLQSYDIIFMDCSMPVLNGFSATRKIRKVEAQDPDHQRTPIIAMTALARSSDKQKCFNAGMDEYLSKPLNVNEIYKVLERYLSKGSVRKDVTQYLPMVLIDKKDQDIEVPGIDLHGLRQRFENKEPIIIEVLEHIIDEHVNNSHEIRTAVASGDIVLATQIVHSLKAVAGYISAKPLEQISHKLEHSFLKNDIVDTDELLFELENELKVVVNSCIALAIKSKPAPEEMKEFVVTPALKRAITPCLDNLEQKLHKWNPVHIEKALEELLAETGNCSGTIGELKKAISKYDFHKALKCIEIITIEIGR